MLRLASFIMNRASKSKNQTRTHKLIRLLSPLLTCSGAQGQLDPTRLTQETNSVPLLFWQVSERYVRVHITEMRTRAIGVPPVARPPTQANTLRRE